MLQCESIGSVPRTAKLQAALGGGNADAIAEAQSEAHRETIKEMLDIAGTYPITDGEQVFGCC
jgi:hypothetical protein